MNKQELKAYIEQLKSRLEEYIIRNVPNYKPGKNFRCLNPGHNDKNPSMTLSKDKNYCHCFSCGATYDIINLLAMDYNKDVRNPKEFVEIIKQGCKDFNIFLPEPSQSPKKYVKIKNGQEYFDECHSLVKDTQYFTKRGLSEKTINRFNLGFDPHYPLSHSHFMQAVIIPRGVNSYTARNTYPNADKENRYRKQGNTRNTFLNIESLEKTEPIFIVEGEFDALSIIEAGYEAIALGSVENYTGFLEICKSRNIKQYLLISLDNDEAGENKSQEFIKALQLLNIKACKVNVSLDFKDANEALINSPAEFKENLKNILANISSLEKQADKLNSIREIIQIFPKNQWDNIENILKLVSALPEAEQNKIFEFIKNAYEQYKKGENP